MQKTAEYTGPTAKAIRHIGVVSDAAAVIAKKRTTQLALLHKITDHKPLDTAGIDAALKTAKASEKDELNLLKEKVDAVNKARAELEALTQQIKNNKQIAQQRGAALAELRTKMYALDSYMNAQVTKTSLENAISSGAWQTLSQEAKSLHAACNKITPDQILKREAKAISDAYGDGWFKKDLHDDKFTEAELNTLYPLTYKEWDRAKNREVKRYAVDDKGKIIKLPLREHLKAMEFANNELNHSDPAARRTFAKRNGSGGVTFDSYDSKEKVNFVKKFQERHKVLEAEKAKSHYVKEEALPAQGVVVEQNLPGSTTQPISLASTQPVPAVPDGQGPQGVISKAEVMAGLSHIIKPDNLNSVDIKVEALTSLFEKHRDMLSSKECKTVLDEYKKSTTYDKKIEDALSAGVQKVETTEKARAAAATTSMPTTVPGPTSHN